MTEQNETKQGKRLELRIDNNQGTTHVFEDNPYDYTKELMKQLGEKYANILLKAEEGNPQIDIARIDKEGGLAKTWGEDLVILDALTLKAYGLIDPKIRDRAIREMACFTKTLENLYHGYLNLSWERPARGECDKERVILNSAQD